MLEGFTRTEIKTSGARIVTVHGGKGPPVLLMHGNPFNHLSWRKIAPRLARGIHRGGDRPARLRRFREAAGRRRPFSGYSFRAMAQDQVEVMAALGFERFRAAGHDRGARVLHRMCLDHPQKVERAAILDIVPQHYLYNNITKAWATFSWHWFFNIQPYRPAREDDGRRPGLVHPQEARQDRAGPELLRQGRARRLHALLPQS